MKPRRCPHCRVFDAFAFIAGAYRCCFCPDAVEAGRLEANRVGPTMPLLEMAPDAALGGGA